MSTAAAAVYCPQCRSENVVAQTPTDDRHPWGCLECDAEFDEPLTHLVGDAQGEIRQQATNRLTDLGDLLKTAEGYGEGYLSPDRLTELGLDPDLDVSESERETEEAKEQAEDRLSEYPLCVDATVNLEVVLGTGGPDDRLIFECDVDLLESSEYGRFGDYTIRRVLYRYSWTGSAEVELHGAERDTAIDFARRVVPELADA